MNITYTFLWINSFLIINELKNVLTFEDSINQTIWSRETTLIVYEEPTQETTNKGFCYHKCKNELNVNNGILIKTGIACKCIFKPETVISETICLNYCTEDERLEGSERDICNYIDKVCYTYKFLKIYKNE